MVDTSLLEKILLLENSCDSNSNNGSSPTCVSVLFISDTSGNKMASNNGSVSRKSDSEARTYQAYCQFDTDTNKSSGCNRHTKDSDSDEGKSNSKNLDNSTPNKNMYRNESKLYNKSVPDTGKCKSDNYKKHVSDNDINFNKNYYYFNSLDKKDKRSRSKDSVSDVSISDDTHSGTRHSDGFTRRHNCAMRQPDTDSIKDPLHKTTNGIKEMSSNSWTSGFEDNSGQEAYHHTTIIKHVTGGVKGTHGQCQCHKEDDNCSDESFSVLLSQSEVNKRSRIDRGGSEVKSINNQCCLDDRSNNNNKSQVGVRVSNEYHSIYDSSDKRQSQREDNNNNSKAQTNTATKSYANKPDDTATNSYTNRPDNNTDDLFTYATSTKDRYLHCLVNKNNLKNNKEQVADNRKKINALSNRLKKSFEALYTKKKQFDALKKKLHVLNNFASTAAMDIDDFYFQRGEYSFRDYVWKPSLIFKTLINIPPLRHKYTQTKRNGIVDFDKKKKTKILNRGERCFEQKENTAAANSKICIYRDRTEFLNNRDNSKHACFNNETNACLNSTCRDFGNKKAGIEIYLDNSYHTEQDTRGTNLNTCPNKTCDHSDLKKAAVQELDKIKGTTRTGIHTELNNRDLCSTCSHYNNNNNDNSNFRNLDTKRTGVNMYLNNTISRRLGTDHHCSRDLGTNELKFDKLYTKYIDRFTISKEKGNTTFRCISIYHNENRLGGPFIHDDADADSDESDPSCSKFISVLYVDKNNPSWERRANRANQVIYEEEIVEDIVIHIIEDESYIYEKRCGRSGASKYKLFYRENKDWCLLEDGA